MPILNGSVGEDRDWDIFLEGEDCILLLLNVVLGRSFDILQFCSG